MNRMFTLGVLAVLSASVYAAGGSMNGMAGFRDAELLAQQARYDVVFELLRISHVLPLHERLKGWRKVV